MTSEACLEEEVPLLEARLHLAVVDLAYNPERLKVVAAMRALEVDDLLLGSFNPSMLALARSGEHSVLPSSGGFSSLPRSQTLRPFQDKPTPRKTPATSPFAPPTPPSPSAPATAAHRRSSSGASGDSDEYFEARSDFSRATSLISEAMSASTLTEYGSTAAGWRPRGGSSSSSFSTATGASGSFSGGAGVGVSGSGRPMASGGTSGPLSGSAARGGGFGGGGGGGGPHIGGAQGGGGGAPFEEGSAAQQWDDGTCVPLVSLAFTQWNAESPTSASVGSEMSMRLSRLVLSAHRPTIAALISLGTDLGAAAATAKQDIAESAQATGKTEGATSSQQLEEEGERVALAAAATPSAPTAPVPRSTIRMAFEMQQLQVVLPYEDGAPSASPPLLAYACIDAFRLNLDVGPETLEVNSRLGNIMLTYEVLPYSAAHRTLCTMRSDAEPPSSAGGVELLEAPQEPQMASEEEAPLVDVTFKSHTAEEAAGNPRVPEGMSMYYSLEAQLRALQLVVLKCSLDEIVDYFAVMVAMQLPARKPPLADPTPSSKSSQPPPKPSSKAPQQQQQQQQQLSVAAPPAQPTAMLLDISMAAPIICLPESRSSTAGVQLDLGSLAISNTLTWQPAAAAASVEGSVGGWVLMDDMQVVLSRLSSVVISPEGVHGPNMIRDVGSGLLLKVTRPLGAALQHAGQIVCTPSSSDQQKRQAPALPPIHVSLDVPDIALALSDSEYEGLVNALSYNFAEVPAGPCQHPAMQALRHAVLQHQQRLINQQQQQPHAPAAGTSSTHTQQQALPKQASSRLAAGGSGTGDASRAGAVSSLRLSRAGSSAVGGGEKAGSAHASGPESDFSLDTRGLLAALGDVCSVAVSVRVHQASLQLLTHLHKAAGGDVQPLAVASLSELCVWVTVTPRSSKVIRIVLPSVQVADSRPGVQPERALVLTTAHVVGPQQQGDEQDAPPEAKDLPPSLLVMEFRSIVPVLELDGSQPEEQGPEFYPPADVLLMPQPRQALQLRLQKPTLVVDLAFILPLADFFNSSSAGSLEEAHGVSLRAAMAREVLLGREPYMAQGDLWLSPEVRLLADAPGVDEYVYDGQGSTIILPPGIPPSEVLPLIMVASNATLRLRNVAILNASSLAACLSLGPGAMLCAREEDGVSMVAVAPDHAARARSVGAGSVSSGSEAGSMAGSRSQSGVELAAGGVGGGGLQGQSVGGVGAGVQQGRGGSGNVVPVGGKSFEMVVHAVGAEVHLVDAGEETAAFASKSSGRQQQQQQAVVGGGHHRRGHSGTYGGYGVNIDQDAKRILRRLALLLDASAKFRMSTEDNEQQQLCDANVTGLTVKAMSTATSRKAKDLHKQQAGLPMDPSIVAAAAAEDRTRSTWACSVLEPCDLGLVLKNTVKGNGEGSVDVKLDVTDLSLKMSPDVLQLILTLQHQIMQPLAVPPIDQPLLRCDVFERLWSSSSTTSTTTNTTPGSARTSASGATVPPAGDLAAPLHSSAASQNAAAGGAGRSGVDPVAHLRGMTVWRPRPPSGYVPLGDVVTAGNEAPKSPVAVLAPGSGLVAWPSSFVCVWSALEGIALWMPVPPAGFVALGCCATAGPDMPPPLQGVCACVAACACVEARLRACLLLSTAGHVWSVANAASSLVVLPTDTHSSTDGTTDLLGLVDDDTGGGGAGTAALSASKQPPQLWDLRSPLGVPPSARACERELRRAHQQQVEAQQLLLQQQGGGEMQELELEQADVPLSKLLQDSFLHHRASLLSAVARIRSVATAVEFRRIWWDKHGIPSPAPQRVSFWRPVPPPGYVALADCMVVGMHAPPPGVMVLADEEPLGLADASPSQPKKTTSSANTGHPEPPSPKAPRPPLLARPVGFSLLWVDEQRLRAGDVEFLSLWKAVPPAGYVALGCMAGTGSLPPPTSAIRCVRADAASRVGLSAASPNWAQPMHRQRTPVMGWIADERLSSFVVAPASPPMQHQQTGATIAPSFRMPDAWCLNLQGADTEDDQAETSTGLATQPNKPEGAGQRLVGLELCVGRCAALLRTCSRIPLLELGAADIRMGLGTHAPGVTRGFAFLTVSAWSYAPLSAVWEPVMEPWQVLGHLDHNTASRTRAGVAPGLWMRINSTQGIASITLAHNAAKSLLQSMGEWMAALTVQQPPSLTSAASPAAANKQQQQQREEADVRVVHGERGKTWTVVRNTLGKDADMLLDYGDRQEVVALPPGASVRVVLPLPRPPPGPLTGHGAPALPAPLGHGAASTATTKGAASSGVRWTPPTIRLLVDVASAHLPAGMVQGHSCEDEREGSGEAARQLADVVCGIKLSGPAAMLMAHDAWGLCTRASAPSLPPHTPTRAPTHLSTDSTTTTSIDWNERFVLTLPPALSEQLVKPAPGDNPFAGNPLGLQFGVAVPSGGGGLGAELAAGSMPVSFDWMAAQIAKLSGKNRRRKQVDPSLQQPACIDVEVPLKVHTQPPGSGTAAPCLRARVTLDTQQVDVADLQRTFHAHAASQAQSSAFASTHPTLSSAAQRFVGSGRRALKLRDCNAWSAVMYTDMQVSGAAEASAGKETEGAPSGAGVVPVVLSGAPTGATGPTRPASFTAKGQPAAAEATEAGDAGSSTVVVETSVASDGTRQEVLRSMCQVINTTELVLEVSLIPSREELERIMADVAAISGGGEPAVREILGQVEPGGRLALPHRWKSEGKELQVRPLLPTPDPFAAPDAPQQRTASHGWSTVPSRVPPGVGGSSPSSSRSGGLSLSSLEDGLSRLVCCPGFSAVSSEGPPDPELQAGGAHMTPEQAAAQPHWMSVVVDCDPLVVAQEGVNVAFDWRIRVQPPLIVRNALPVAAQYIVWERTGTAVKGLAPTGGSGTLRACGWGRMDAWGAAQVYTADMRQQVYLSFWPDGCAFAEVEPVLISEGVSKALTGGAPRLPDSFRCTYAHSTSHPPGMPLRMYLSRSLDSPAYSSENSTGGEGTHTGQAGQTGQSFTTAGGGPSFSGASPRGVGGADEGSGVVGAGMGVARAVSKGVPLYLRLWVPLWVVNGTQMPVTTGVVTMELPQQQGQPGPQQSGDSFSAALAADSGLLPSQLRIMDTGAASLLARPASHVSIMPRSLELLSHSLLPPPPSPGNMGGMSAPQQQQQQWQQQQQQQGTMQVHGVCVSVLGSRWTPPIVLPLPGQDRSVDGTPAGGSMSEGALIRARSSDGGTVHELVAHVGPAGAPSMLTTEDGPAAGTGAHLLASGQSQQSMVLRLEPALVVVNRTGFDLTLLQPESVMAVHARGAGGASVPMQAGRNTGPLGAGAGTAQADCAARIEAVLARTGSLPPPPATLTIPAGAVGVPMHWHTACDGRLLCLALPTSEGVPLLSEPFRSGSLIPGEDVHMLLPVCTLPTPTTPTTTAAAAANEEVTWARACHTAHSKLDAACRGHAGAAHSAAHSRPFLMRTQRASTGPVPAPSAVTQGTGVGVGDSAHACVGVVVSVRLVPRGPPGCWALILSGVGGQPPHLLHNAAPMPVAYHEASRRMPWQLLPPFAAHGFVRQDMLSMHTRPANQPANAAASTMQQQLLQQPQQQQQSVKVEVCSHQGATEVLTMDLCSEASATAAHITPTTPPAPHTRTHPSAHAPSTTPTTRGLAIAPNTISTSFTGGPPTGVSPSRPPPNASFSAAPGAATAAGRAAVLGSQAPTGMHPGTGAATGSSGGAGGAGAHTRVVTSGAAGGTALHMGGVGGGDGFGDGGRGGVGGMGGGGGGGGEQDGSDRSLVAQLADAAELVMAAGGVVYVQGGGGTQNTALGGAPRSERVLRLVPSLAWPGMTIASASGVAPMAKRPGSRSSRRGGTWMLLPTTRVLTPDLALGGVAASVHVSVEVSGLEISLVDHRPQELLLLTLEGLVLEWSSGSSGGLAHSHFNAKLGDLQVDDQLPESPHPVVLMASDESRQSDLKKLPLIVVQLVSESGRHRGCAYYPSIAVSVQPMHLALGEALLWRLVTAARLLMSAMPSARGGAGAGASPDVGAGAGPASAAGQGTAAQATSQLPLQIDLMNITDVDLKLSFKADAMSRPRIANQTLSLALDLASLRELPLALPGVELESVRVQQAALQQLVVARLQQRIFGIAMSVLYSSGVFGSASKIFAAASHGVTTLTDASDQRGGGGGPARRSEVTHMGEGFTEGGRAFAQNMLRGATGMFTKPMEGAGRGLGGFFGGVAKGVVGAAASPIGGALAAASKVTEGMDAQYRMLYGSRQTTRKRLPRPFTGDRMLRPFSLHPALGQALLHGATLPESATSAMTVGLSRRLLSRVVGTGNSSAAAPNRSAAVFIGDIYEDHFLLPGNQVLLITTNRLILLDAPDFVALQLRVMSGEVAHVTDVPGGTVAWELRYKSMLTAELAWHQQLPGLPPDGVLVHRKKRSQRDGTLVYDVRCRPNSHQAQEVLQAINTTRKRNQVRPGQIAAELKSKQMLPAVSDASQHLPETALSVDFQPVWLGATRTVTGGQSLCSIWRPVGPPGYASMGDVAEPSADRPHQPVRMYRDTAPTEDDTEGEGPDAKGPRLAPPVGYALVFRDSAPPPITLWRPVPPRGYVDIGCVAWPGMAEPPTSLVRCVRADLVGPTKVYEAPLWQGVSSDNKFWAASLWLMDSPLSTFLASKNAMRPPPGTPRVPLYL